MLGSLLKLLSYPFPHGNKVTLSSLAHIVLAKVWKSVGFQ